jgi:hypothetical protein
MIQKKINSEYYFLILVCFFSILIVLPIVYFGIPDTIDLPQHYKFAQTYYDSIISGDFFPGWAGNENSGYGDIGIRFYPPLAYYFLAFGRILTGNWYDASWLTFMFWMVLGCLGIFYWARCWFSVKESSLIAAIYIVIPFHLHQLYTGFNQFSEFAAASLLTFCFAFLTRILQREKLTDILGLGCFFGLLIITHLPSTIVGSICLFAYFLTFIRKNNFVQPFLKSAAAVIFSLSATSFYWVRLISEMKWLNHTSERFSTGYFDFAQNFFPFSYYSAKHAFQSHFIVDLIIIFTILFFLSTFFYLILRKKDTVDSGNEKSIYQTVLPVGLFAFFMFTPLSKPIWEIITPLQKIQFPIRWMPVTAMCGAMICGGVINYLWKEGFMKQRLCFHTFFIISAIVLLFDFTYIVHPTSFVPLERQRFESILNELPNEPSFSCWWAIWSKPEALKVKEKVLADGRQTSVINWEREKKVFEISEGNNDFARIAVFYYPLWKATVNGKPVELEKDSNGAIQIPVSREKSLVNLYFQEPLAIRIAGYFSSFMWFLLVLLLILQKSKFQNRIFKDKYHY